MGNGITSFSPTAMQQARIQQQQLRAASYGTYNYQPNVAAITMEDVGRRCLVPTRVVAWNLQGATAVPAGADVIAAIDAAIAPAGFPLNAWNNQLAADREECYGDTLVGLQVSVQCSVTFQDAGGIVNATSIDNLADSIEQLLYQRYSLVVNPTSGNRSPIVFDTELRAFSPTHRLSGADGYTMIPATPWGDEFATIQITTSPNPVVGAYALNLPGGAGGTYNVQGCISVALKKVRGTGG